MAEPSDKDRVKECGLAVRKVLEEYDCVMTVSEIPIDTGQVLPIIKIQARVAKQSCTVRPDVVKN